VDVCPEIPNLTHQWEVEFLLMPKPVAVDLSSIEVRELHLNRSFIKKKAAFKSQNMQQLSVLVPYSTLNQYNEVISTVPPK